MSTGLLIQIVFIGLMIASLSLIAVWLSRTDNKYKKLIGVTAFLTFDLIVFGAFTRLTDSGLGCPDWPGCYGESNPFLAHELIHAAQSAMPTGPVTLQKAWIEMIHRYLATSVGILIIAQMIFAWRNRRTIQQSPWFATGLFFLVCLQGAFGAWTVTLKLQPVIVTIHLLLGMALLLCLVWSYENEGALPLKTKPSMRIRGWAALALIVLIVQIALGGWVSTNYAALACQDYPLCQGNWLPIMDFQHGFALWRKLGQTMTGEFISVAALVAIHWVHRNFALLVIAVVVMAVMQTKKLAELRQLSTIIFTTLFLQLATGLATIFFSWPLVIAVLHNAGAAILVASLTMLNCRLSRRNMTE
jgi:cytochrome c oxidase assembly protein subunit 15